MMRTLGALCLCFTLASCVREQPSVIVITATFEPGSGTPSLGPLAATPTALMADVTPVSPASTPGQYIVRPGDTLSGVAANLGISLEMLMAANADINPNALSVGQVLAIPAAPSATTPDIALLPDGRLVRGPGSRQFDIGDFISRQTGFIRTATDTVNGSVLTSAQVVERVSYEYSVDARTLLTLLELRSGWLSDPIQPENEQIYALGAPASPLGFDRNGLYRQLAWAADQLNRGYYGRKYGGLSLVEFADEGAALRLNEVVNVGTAALHYMLAQYNTYANWQREVSTDGFYSIYVRLFGNPFENPLASLIPQGLEQPQLVLPFPAGQEWFYTGGPHGGWGIGSAWAAIDFAPPEDLTKVSSGCYTSTDFATAVAPGIIARTTEGVVILDLDGDGDEATGWSILYLHVDEQDRVQSGTVVRQGDRIGRLSCDGGVSNGTHLHIARRYNGEWLPADCSACRPEVRVPNFMMSGWTVFGFDDQEYQGILVQGSEERLAWQGRENPANRIMWNTP